MARTRTTAQAAAPPTIQALWRIDELDARMLLATSSIRAWRRL
jgi:hypothetical protein